MRKSFISLIFLVKLYIVFIIKLQSAVAHVVFTHCRILRDQLLLLRSSGVGQKGASDSLSHLPPVDLGPDPSDLTVTENELASENTLELNKLRSLLSKARAEVEVAKAEVKRLQDEGSGYVAVTKNVITTNK